MDDDKKFKDAFGEIKPPDELKEKVRQSVSAQGGNKRNSDGTLTAARRPWAQKHIVALIVAAVMILLIMIPIVGYFGFNSTGNEFNGLRSFTSMDEVKRYVGERKFTPRSNWFDDGDSVEANGSDGSPSAPSDSPAEHSSTNNQVEGVSESDVTHTDGNYIYTISYYTLSIIDVRGGAFELKAELEYNNFSPSEMFLMKDEGKLVVLGSYYTPSMFYDYASGADAAPEVINYWQVNSTAVRVYDIQHILGGGTDFEREMKFENCYTSASRMIDGKLYLVMNAYRYYSGNELWMPGYTDTQTGEVSLAASDIFATPDNGYNYNFTLIAGVDLKANGEADVKAYFGSTGTLYASKTAFYITYNRYEKVTFFGYQKYENLGLGVMRFEINGIGLDYKGLGKVAGYVINQFAMDEYTYGNGETYFRIATTEQGNSDSYITVFDKDMKQVGKLNGLGEENERIYSVRFDGEQAVVVTYYQMDPLYVIDLSSPSQPCIKSALKIPGVSDYLHFLKIKDGYVFAVGRTENLWGLKVSLFDITGDVTREVEYFEVGAGIAAGNGYSESEATYNHKAIMYFMPAWRTEEIFAFPVNTYSYSYANNVYTSNNVSDLYYYSVDTSGAMTQSVLGYNAENKVIIDGNNNYYRYYEYYRDSIRRSVIAGDYLYLVGYSGIERYDRQDLGAPNGDIIKIGGDYLTRF